MTYSIVIETENLANGDISDLERCLDSIQRQRLDFRPPNEVLLVESGQVDHGVLEPLRAKYAWLSVYVSPTALHYYEAKLAGAARVTGDVVVFADSDLVYEDGWLAALLDPFDRSDAAFVSGETRVQITGPYTFSVATTWLFPRRYASGHASSLIANNAAVRRSTLLACPFPAALPLYRAQIVVHGRLARRQGLPILNVRARGNHAPPAGLREWALRFAVSGADAVAASTFRVTDSSTVEQHSTLTPRAAAWARSLARKVASSMVRTVQALSEQPARVAYLPVALPISVAALTLFAVGGLSVVLGSGAAHRRMRAFEAAAGGVRA